jgi:hypothetical protein
MPIRTLNLLPKVFQTDHNKKFLNATLDQLTTEPNFARLNGYVGKKTSPAFIPTDNYVIEPALNRQQYQLEPSVVVKEPNKDAFIANYNDMVNAVNFAGGDNIDHNKLFANKYYSYDGLFDFDKLVNYNQYYWLPNGLDPVVVSTGDIATAAQYTITRDSVDDAYKITDYVQLNPLLVLARGGTYTFTVNQTSQFYIQAAPGTAGEYPFQTNISAREVYGVTNNGADNGTVTFVVPQRSAQDWILDLPEQDSVNYATTLNYAQIQGANFDSFINTYGGIDGVKDLNNKVIVFVNPSSNDADWYDPYTDSIIPTAKRANTFIVRVDTTGSAPTLRVEEYILVGANYKFKVLGGNDYGYRYFYKEPVHLQLELLPPVTANIDTLYYQDSTNTNMLGLIKLIDTQIDTPINVDTDIVGQKNYTSPNNVVFTNGLRVQFDTTATPPSYQLKEYYVEGVGDAIRLVPVSELIVPETWIPSAAVPWDSNKWDSQPWDPNVSLGPTQPDYFTINRASRDRNSWSRTNRWFHIDVINAVAEYNNYTPTIDKNANAKRPIIEFNYDVQLYNSGSVFKQAINAFDTVTTDAFSHVEGSSGYAIDGITLTNGMFVVFAAETDENVRNKVYKVNIVDPSGDGSSITHLTLVEHAQVLAKEGLLVRQGTNYQGKMVWFDGTAWHTAQQKLGVNQSPLFDVFDDSGISYSDTSKYPSTTFAGNKIFSYRPGNGKNDINLGLALTYKSIANIGDIVFDNNLDAESFAYTLDNTVKTIQLFDGKLHVNNSLTNYTQKTVWTPVFEDSKQFQHLEYLAEQGQTEFLVYSFGDPSNYVNNFKLFVNNKFVNSDNYVFETIHDRAYIILTSALSLNDKVDIFVYASTQTIPNAYYEIPKNLEVNALNAVASTFTLGQLRRHIGQIYQNSKQVTGSYLGSSNLRDLPKIKDIGGTLLQHSASVVPAALFMTHPDANLIDAINNAAREYTRFKNKVLDQALKLDLTKSLTVPQMLDEILGTINAVKTKDFAWYYSDMLAYGEDSVENVTTITIENDAQLEYDLYTKFDLTQPSRRGVCVYVNDNQLVHGIDYTFLTIRPAIALTAGTIATYDVLKIVEYNTTNGSYIPETPTKLGLWPSKSPRLYTDDTFVTETLCIEGHDGSIIPAFGDFRDDILLEFEKRIYNNLKVQWNLNKLSVFDVKSGAFRTTDYSRDQYNNILSQFFNAWASKYGLDYTTNDTFLSNNSFTWNYKKLSDRVFGELLQGGWRAIFDHFYDTMRPHTHPWEMLGFDQKPSWWQQRYGAAPYTSGNLVLWEDLRDGRIFTGDRAGIDARFARPDLLDIIPTDEYGELRPPVEIFVKAFDSRKTKISWAFGDIGPVEAAWRRSSEFAFASQAAMSVAKPAKYFGLFIDNDKYLYDAAINEFTFNGLNRRLQVSDYVLNSETVDTEIVSKASYLNWIIDRLNGQGVNGVDRIRSLIDNLTVNLTYAFAGYTGPAMLNSFAEQASPNSVGKSILVPEENQSIVIKKSVPLLKIVYSAVIIERTGTGFKVQGYDIAEPYFTIIPSLANSNSTTITVMGNTATVYNDYDAVKTTIPYGTEFVNKQQVVDFLISYNRYLVSQGIRFNEYEGDLGANRDFILSAQEFLNWSQQGWDSQTVIVLNPLANKVFLTRPGYVVDEINGSQVGASRVLDQNFNYLRDDQFNVVRINNSFTINAVNSNLALVEMNLVQYEHAIVYDNRTIFNDVIYEPETGNRQLRIKLVGYKTREWDGSVYAPGFIYNSTNVDAWTAGVDYKAGALVEYKNQYYTALMDVAAENVFEFNKWQIIDKNKIKTGLLPNFSNLAGRSERFYDITNANFESSIDLYSKGLIGFRPRSYLTELGIDDISQVKFYQGYIREKGTNSALNALLGAKFDRFTTEIDAYENWAIRVGEFGAIDSTQVLELVLTENNFAANPSFLSLLNDGDTAESGTTGYSPNAVGDGKIVIVPKNYTKNLFLTTTDKLNVEEELLTAGYLKTTHADTFIFDLTNINADSPATLIDPIGSGHKIWVAKKNNKDWTLLRAEQTQVQVINITNALDNTLAVKTSDRHNLAINDYIVIKNFDINFNFIYRVKEILDLKTFKVDANTTLTSNLSGFNSLDGTGVLYKLSTVRFNTVSDWAAYTPREGWQTDDVAAIDHWGPNYVDWAVFKKRDIWSKNQTLDAWDASTNQNYGSSVAFVNTGDYMLVGAPAEGTGKVFVYIKDSNGQYQHLTSITQSTANLSGFGTTLTGSNADYFAVGCPTSDTNTGFVYIYKINTSLGTVSLVGSVKTGPSTGSYLGQSLSFSKDGLWLYVGAPGVNRVYIWGRSSTTFYQVGTYITPADIGAGDQFGYSVSCSTDGAQVLVGAPFNDTGSTDAGAVYIYDRSIESFVGDGSTTVYTLLRSPDTNIKLSTVEGVVQTGETYTGSGNKTVTFSTAPGNGSLIKIASNNFQLLKKLTTPVTQSQQQFGTSTVLCPFDCTAYVGAPLVDSANSVQNAGAVYRYTNMGRLYGKATGTVTNPAVTIGHGIRINDFDVVFTGTSLTSVVNDINNKAIPGIGASAVNNQLYIECDIVLVADKLRILPGSGTALTDLGLDVFKNTQTISNPNPIADDQFGTVLAISDDALKLAIGSALETSIETTSFDGNTTTFDLGSLKFVDQVGQSGAVLVYEYVSDRIDNDSSPGSFILDRYLEPGNLQLANKFGSSVAMNGSYIAVGAIGDDKFGSNYGAMYVFAAAKSTAWYVDGQAVPRVNTDAINRLFLYDSVTHTKLVDLELIDPVKVKVPGNAISQIDFVEDLDPAVYGDTAASINEIWGSMQVGKVWWNTDKVRYLDYEQGDFQYRSTHWGDTFPGSEIEICEWTRSSVLPSSYVAVNGNNFDGYPVFGDARVVTETRTDAATGLTMTNYYYWVRRKTTVNTNSGRTLTISAVEDLITDPKAQGLAYAVVLSNNSIGLYNTATYLNASNTLLHVDYDVQLNTDVIHAEYDLVQENNPRSRPADSLLSKLIDSLSGQDAMGKEVPDTNLYGTLKYGIENRPRQGMFVNRLTALKVMLLKVNEIFSSYKLVEIYDTDRLKIAEPAPSAVSGAWDESVANLTELSYINTSTLTPGYKVLVENDSNYYNGWSIHTYSGGWSVTSHQSYNLNRFWQYVDYVASSYDASKLPKYTVENKYDLLKNQYVLNDTVKIMDNGSGRYEIIKYVNDDTGNLITETLVLENGTVNFTNELYTQALVNDGSTLSQTYSKELRNLFELLFNDLFTNELEKHVNELFFVAIRYILREQKNVDWLFKTSLIDIKHYFRKLEQQSVYLKDNQTFLLDYITETKPYHTKIREYLINYTGLDDWAGDPSDFDLPAYYDGDLSVFRSPSGEKSTDANKLETDLHYRMWNLNHGYGVDSVMIENAGVNYLVAPDINIIAATGDTGSGAKAYALVSGGKLREIIVTDPGKNYTKTPTVEVVANDSGTSGKLYAQLGNKTIRKWNTTIRFDRYTYGTAVLTWAASTYYLQGQYIAHNHVLYKVEVADGSSAGFTSSTTFDTDNLVKISNQDLAALMDGDFGSANDRITAYYQPRDGMPGQDLAQVQTGIDYPGVIVDAQNFTDLPTNYPTIASGLDDTVITSQFTDTDLGTRAEDILVDGKAFIDVYSSHAPQELIPGRMYDTLNMQVHTVPRTDYNYIIKTWAAYSYYAKGDYIKYGTQLYQALFAYTTGAAFSIYGPDGSTIALTARDPLTAGAGPEITNLSFTADGTTTQFSFREVGHSDDVLFVYTKNRGLQKENTDFTVNYNDKSINFAIAPLANETVFISVQSHGGNFLLYDKTYQILAATTQIILPTYDNLVQDLLVFVNGQRVFEGTASNQFTHAVSNNLYNIQFNTALVSGDYVHVYVYSQPQTYREIHNTYQSFDTLPSVSYPTDYTITLDRPLKTSGPYHANIIVLVNNNRLRTPENTYLTGDGSTITFTPNYVADINGATVDGNDIEVYVNGQRKTFGADYTLTALDGSTLRSVIFNTAPAMGDVVVLSETTGAQFSMIDAQTILIAASVALTVNSKVRIISYADHDTSLIKTKVYSGAGAATISIPHGFDTIGFDSEDSGFDSSSSLIITTNKYPLQYTHTNTNYVLVYQNGQFLQPNTDWDLADSGSQVEIHRNISASDIIIITEFTENSQGGLTSFRIFKNLLDQTNYYAINYSDSTKLSADLGIFDTEISVQNALALPAPSTAYAKPGVIFINGERIAYWERDTVNNKLGRIIRATGGTGAPQVHAAGSDLVSAGKNQEITSLYDNSIVAKWQPLTQFKQDTYVLFEGSIYQVTTTFTSGASFTTANLTYRAQFRDMVWYDMNNKTLSLVEADTTQAVFLRQKAGFIPT